MEVSNLSTVAQLAVIFSTLLLLLLIACKRQALENLIQFFTALGALYQQFRGAQPATQRSKNARRLSSTTEKPAFSPALPSAFSGQSPSPDRVEDNPDRVKDNQESNLHG